MSGHLGYKSVLILAVETFVQVDGKYYVVLSTALYQDNDGEIGQNVTMLPVTVNGIETGESPIQINPDMHDIVVI